MLDICHVCTHAWMTRTNQRSVMKRLLHHMCTYAATSGSSGSSALENSCTWSALPSNRYHFFVEKCSERAGFVCRGGVQFLPLGCQETDDGQSWCVRNRSFFPSALHVVSNIERLSIQLILTRWNINMFWGLSTNDGI